MTTKINNPPNACIVFNKILYLQRKGNQIKSFAMRHVRYVIILVVLAMTFRVAHKEKPTDVLSCRKGCQLRAGDVVFRRGGGVTSYAVLVADPEGNYSHVGIVADSAGKKIIIHAVPGEPDYQGDSWPWRPTRPNISSLRYMPAGALFAGTKIRHSRQGIQVGPVQMFRAHVLFDHDYNLKDTTQNVLYRTIGLLASTRVRARLWSPSHAGTTSTCPVSMPVASCHPTSTSQPCWKHIISF